MARFISPSSKIGRAFSFIPRAALSEPETPPLGDSFLSLIPSASDGYLLSGIQSTRFTGTQPHTIENGFVRAAINGQGVGVLGVGFGGGVSPQPLQLVYDPAGNGNYDYSSFGDAFQPGTPHEMAMFVVDGNISIGGGNEGNPGNGNSTVYSWKTSETDVIVLLGSASAGGHAVFQYKMHPNKAMLHMKMSYTNTTSSARTVTLQRGGDPDFDDFTTNNFRGYSSTVPAENLVYAVGRSTGRTIALATRDTVQHNSRFTSLWPNYNPNSILSGGLDGSVGDMAMYLAWNFGTVQPGQTVTAYCAYLLGTSIENALQNYASINDGSNAPPPTPTPEPTPTPTPPPSGSLVVFNSSTGTNTSVTGGWTYDDCWAGGVGTTSSFFYNDGEKLSINAPYWGCGTAYSVNDVDLRGATSLTITYSGTGLAFYSNSSFGWKKADGSGDGYTIQPCCGFPSEIPLRTETIPLDSPGIGKLAFSAGNTDGGLVYLYSVVVNY